MQHLYNEMFDRAIAAYRQNTPQTDPLIDDPADTRRGISLILRPSAALLKRLSLFRQPLQFLRQQYFHPDTDIHATILSIISAKPNITLEQIPVAQYIPILQKALETCPKPMEIDFRGVTASPSCIMIQGWNIDWLNDLRQRLRTAIRDAHLPEDMDTRYKLRVAHLTALRFRAPISPADTEKLISILQQLRDTPFSTTPEERRVTPQFIFNDWYMRREKCTILKQWN